MAAHCTGIAQAEVDVVDAIEALEVRTRRSPHIDGPRARPLGHPEHGYSVGHVLGRALELPLGGGMLRPEQLELALPEASKALPVVIHDGADLSLTRGA